MSPDVAQMFLELLGQVRLAGDDPDIVFKADLVQRARTELQVLMQPAVDEPPTT